MTVERYPHLFSPLKIGNITLRNRIMQSAHAMAFNSPEGLTTDRDVYYHAARAKGGIGLMITGNRLIHPTSNTFCRGYSYGYRPEMVERDRALTDVVHGFGSHIFAQLNHFGVMGETHAMDDYRVLWSASNIKSPVFGEMAKAMERSDMDEVVEGWVVSAEYSKQAGFDGVEVHLAHSYLLHQFISPLFNKRDDEYGGSFENRMRFPLEVIRAVRERVGPDYVVGIRLSMDEMVPGGMEIEDWIEVARTVEATGDIDYIMATAGVYQSATYIMPPYDVPNGWLADPVARLKRAVQIPVFCVSGIGSAGEAETILARGGADMVAMTRAQIADPEFAIKTAEGREDEIYHCLRCNQGCVSRLFHGTSMTCQINPATGREEVFGPQTLELAPVSKHWVVVGGGPAGMKAAEGLAKRGHQVTLLEKGSELGGQVNHIVRLPRRDSFAWITEDLKVHMAKHGVQVKLNCEAGVEMIRALNPDGVIVATGSLPDRSGYSDINPLVDKVPGLDSDRVLTALDVLAHPERVGKRVLVLDEEGNRYSAGITELLVDNGHEVHVLTRWNALFHRLATTLDQPIVYANLFSQGLTYTLNAWVSEVRGSDVVTFNLYTGDEETLSGFDSIVLAVRHLPEDRLYHQLKEALPNVHRVGDAVVPRKTDHAIFEGFLAGREVFDNWKRYIEPGAIERFSGPMEMARFM
ncbi:mycofactocin system FadH/OYE family oxidoreductase 2 [Pseudomonas sp. G11-1]|nr:mycofactocin system FadH/OYE family oxidoreductase 2 [Pseudomonas sp. G11-1]MCO5788078.1 mycofactocin system FadH/OYE family oxidoreductase 2 [Pseudomonas sp. G11-2]